MKVIDNALPQETFLDIKNNMLKSDFPWYYRSVKVASGMKQDNQYNSYNKYNFQFVHVFYKHFKPRSEYVSLLNPILDILHPASIIRIKANLTTRAPEVFQYNFHQDLQKFSGKTAIFYVNSNDGYTAFENGQKIDSIENRLVIFDSPVYHAGTSCTNRNVRCVINFNFTEWDE